jgi:hypothetical protein
MIQGFPLTDANGNKTMNIVTTEFYTDKEKGLQISAASQNPQFTYYNDEFVLYNLFKWNNPGLSIEALQDIINAYDPFTMSPLFR